MGGNAIGILNLLYLSPERKVKCWNEYFINGHIFHTKEYGQGRRTYNYEGCVKGSIFNEFEVDYYEKLEKLIKLQYHNKQNSLFIQMLLVSYH